MSSVYHAGKPSNDPTHVDYIPSIFVFTSSPQRRTLVKQVQRYEHVAKIKRRSIGHENDVIVGDKVSSTGPQLEVISEDSSSTTQPEQLNSELSNCNKVSNTEPRKQVNDELQKRTVAEMHDELEHVRSKLKESQQEAEKLKKRARREEKTGFDHGLSREESSDGTILYWIT